MSFSWTEKSEQEGPVYAEKLPDGQHRVTITRLIFGTRDGQPFQSKSGDSQIMLIFADDQAREVSQMITLNDRAGWVLARILGRCDPPANLARMEADGVLPAHFADQNFAENNFLIGS